MTIACNICNKSFTNQESLNQHNQSKHYRSEKKLINLKKYFIFFALAIIIGLSAYMVTSNMNKAGEYDAFSQCLTKKGAVVYGNDYCQYTIKQLNFFGKSKDYLNYVKCIDNPGVCEGKKVSITPTWEINGKMYEQVQTFEQLSAYSGCALI